MRKILPILVVAVVAFAVGWYASTPTAATAAPTYRWSSADEAHYAALLEAHTELRRAFGAVFGQLVDFDEDGLAAIHTNAQAIADLEPTIPMLAVDSIANYAASYCAAAADWATDAVASGEYAALLGGPLLQARDHCSRALADVKVELARFAAANGGFPAAAPASTPTKRP